MTIYQELLEASQALGAMIELDHHETDLYIRCTMESRKLIRELLRKPEHAHHLKLITVFQGNDGKPWYEIPFAYYPAWEQKRKQNTDQGRT